ncbi:hypothetical protein BWQ92_00220 [Arthrobacter sp. QXT-31]|nr:hypothetical protein BWQ92_00220 [Arthrobacter sp. QXT-31]
MEGVRGSGVIRIIEEAEVAKSSFYRHFPSKEHLVLAYPDEMDALWTALRAAAGPDRTGSANPLAGMSAALLWDGHPEDYRGAALVKASAEAIPGSAVQVRVAAHRAGVLEWIRASCRRSLALRHRTQLGSSVRDKGHSAEPTR